MKNLVFLFLFVICLFTGFNQTDINTVLDFRTNITEICDDEVIRVEYVLIDGQWYQITYYSDGRIDIVPVAAPILD